MVGWTRAGLHTQGRERQSKGERGRVTARVTREEGKKNGKAATEERKGKGRRGRGRGVKHG